jgi:hypothetical protein
MDLQADREPHSQHERTMRDLARYDRGEQSPDAIRKIRKQTEQSLDCQLRKANSFLTVDKVMALVFESETSGWPTFLAAMLTAFDCDVDSVEDAVLYVIDDAWSYFPHRYFGGHCPTEIFGDGAWR